MNKLYTWIAGVCLAATTLSASAAETWIADPESGSTIPALTEFKLRPSDETGTRGMLDAVQASRAIVKKDGTTYCSLTVREDMNDWSYYFFAPTKSCTEAGTYTVTFPPKSLGYSTPDWEDVTNTAPVTLTYIVTGEQQELTHDLAYTKIYPADGATINLQEWWSNASMSMPSSVKVKSGAKATLSNGADYNQSVSIAELYGSVLVKLPEAAKPTVDGAYTLTIPAGVIYSTTQDNPEYKITYNITAGKQQEMSDAKIVSISYVSPDGSETAEITDGCTLKALAPDSKIVVNTTDNLGVGYLQLTVTDLNPLNPDEAVNVYESHARRTINENRGVYWQDNQVPFLQFSKGIELIDGHNYTFDLKVFDEELTFNYGDAPLDSKVLRIKGSTAGFEYSPVKILSITPDPEVFIINSVDEGTFTMTFDGYVDVNFNKTVFQANGGGKPVSPSCVSFNDDHTELTFTFPASELENAIGSVGVMLYLVDQQGRPLFFGADTKENSYYCVNYSCYLGAPDLTVTPEGGIVTEISEIYISCPKGPDGGMINLSNLGDIGNIKFTDKSGDVVFAEFTAQPVITKTGSNKDGEFPKEFKFTLDTPITTPGDYILNIPPTYFVLGAEYNAMNTKGQYISFVIEGEIADETLYDFQVVKKEVTFGATNSKVKLTFEDAVYVNSYAVNSATLTDSEGNVIETAKISNDWVWDDLTIWYVNIDYAFDAQKVYTLNIPQGSFGDSQWGEDPSRQFRCGHANKAFTVKIAPDSSSAISELFAEGRGTVAVYNLQGIKVADAANADALKTLPAGCYIAGGKKILVK